MKYMFMKLNDLPITQVREDMDIIKNDVKDIITKVGYKYIAEYSDEQLNMLFNYWYLFDEKEKEIQGLLGVSLDLILYSKYYWCTRFRDKYNELYGKDVGIDQQQYKIVEDMTQRINDVDWSFVQRIEEGRIGL